RHDDAVIASLAVRLVEQAAHRACRGHRLVSRLQLEIDAIDLVTVSAGRVLEAEDGGPQRYVDEIVAILGRHAIDAAGGTHLRPRHTDHPEPLLVDLHEFT